MLSSYVRVLRRWLMKSPRLAGCVVKTRNVMLPSAAPYRPLDYSHWLWLYVRPPLALCKQKLTSAADGVYRIL